MLFLLKCVPTPNKYQPRVLFNHRACRGVPNRSDKLGCDKEKFPAIFDVKLFRIFSLHLEH